MVWVGAIHGCFDIKIKTINLYNNGFGLVVSSTIERSRAGPSRVLWTISFPEEISHVFSLWGSFELIQVGFGAWVTTDGQNDLLSLRLTCWDSRLHRAAKVGKQIISRNISVSLVARSFVVVSFSPASVSKVCADVSIGSWRPCVHESDWDDVDRGVLAELRKRQLVGSLTLSFVLAVPES